ncbi:MAG: DNA polymerase III subunit delta, partial [Myxococcales bacterium]|nr:DNA polymerase III subunit delta [Myxococcales bacterium]
MTLDELRAELEAAQVRSSYLVVGAEPLLRDDALEAIRIAVLADGPSDFDYERLDGEMVTGAALLDAVGTLPVLAPRRLVVLREPEAARAKARGLTDALGEALVAVKDSRDTVLVVVAEKVDGRSRWVKAFGSAAVVRCDPPRKGRALSDFIAAEASRQGVDIDQPAIALLAERTGPQLLMLRQEIAKAALFAGPGEKVKAKHVAESTSDVAEGPIWDLTDAIGEGRCGDALALDFPAESFDAAISQESFLHIADKGDLFGRCRGVLRKGGRLGFTDWIALAGITDADRRRLSEGIAAVDIVSPKSYREYMEQCGFRHVRFEDVSPWWRIILRDRLRMYESLREETV